MRELDFCPKPAVTSCCVWLKGLSCSDQVGSMTHTQIQQ